MNDVFLLLSFNEIAIINNKYAIIENPAISINQIQNIDRIGGVIIDSTKNSGIKCLSDNDFISLV